MTPESFLQQVAWPKVQPSFVVGKGGGVTPLAWVVMELMMIMLRTSMLLRKLGIQGPHRIGAYFDKDFSLIFFIFLYLFCFVFIFAYFILFYFHFNFLHLGQFNLVNRGVWVDKDLASQRSLLRKLLKETTRKLLEEAS